VSDSNSSQSFFVRHEFALRRLHSLSGIVPLGAYMVVHLMTNASLLNGVATFQRAVFSIHSLGALLPVVEWGLILLPLLFHGILGLWIAKTGRSNSSAYTFTNNRRYTWQRWTGLIAFVFLMVHVLHLHGWFHFKPWLAMLEPLGLAGFKPYNAASTLILQMDGYLWPAFYLIGVLACVYHLANGLWTAGITWGLWATPTAQLRATKVCSALGVLLAVVGVAAWWAAVAPGPSEAVEARQKEIEMYEAAKEMGVAYEKPEKLSEEALEILRDEPGGESRAAADESPRDEGGAEADSDSLPEDSSAPEAGSGDGSRQTALPTANRLHLA